MGIKFYDSNGKYWGEYDETRNLFIPSEEPITKTETQNSNLTFEKRTMRDCYNCKRYETEGECIECHFEPKADTPQTEETCGRCVYVRGSQWCQGCNGTPKRWDGEKIVDILYTDCGWGEPNE